MADSFVFYRSFFEGVDALPAEEQAAAYKALCLYALDGTEPERGGLAYVVFVMARAQIDANNKRRENGRTGGTHKQLEATGKQNEATPKQSQATGKQTEATPKQNEATASKWQANANVNVNDNVNVNVNEKHTNARARECVSDRDLEKEFNELWATFPKKAGNKSTALTSYKRARKNGTTREAVADGIERYKAWIASESVETRYIMQGTTFFVGRRWLDEWKVSQPRDSNKFSSGMITHEYTDDEWAELEAMGNAV